MIDLIKIKYEFQFDLMEFQYGYAMPYTENVSG